jgi:hypothetical protein
MESAQTLGPLSDFAKTFHYARRGVGPSQRADPDDRPDFGGQATLLLRRRAS